ncbi:MAG: hypothetical protein OES12_03540, partial [Anaerolineae bacterium]|nr:hypothetical protein [Anaerolineae bacterium]
MSLSFSSRFPEFGSPITSRNGQGDSSQAGPYGSTAIKTGLIRGQSAVEQPVAYEIAHQVNGRLRLQIPRLAYDKAFARRLAEAVLALPAVTRARVRPQSRSLVVHYEQRTFRPGGNGHDDSEPSSILPGLAKAMRAAASGELERDLTISKTGIGDKDRINYFR